MAGCPFVGQWHAPLRSHRPGYRRHKTELRYSLCYRSTSPVATPQNQGQPTPYSAYWRVSLGCTTVGCWKLFCLSQLLRWACTKEWQRKPDFEQMDGNSNRMPLCSAWVSPCLQRPPEGGGVPPRSNWPAWRVGIIWRWPKLRQWLYTGDFTQMDVVNSKTVGTACFQWVTTGFNRGNGVLERRFDA